jgi:hypothetical protein
MLGLSLPVPSTTSWREKIDGKRFSGVNEIDGTFWAISLKARLVGRDFCANSKISGIKSRAAQELGTAEKLVSF